MKRTLRLWRADAHFHYEPRRPRALALRMITNPSLVAALLFRLGSSRVAIVSVIARWLLISGFSCDVGRGAQILGPIDLPHPVGVVIGRGAIIRGRARIYQNVTIGSSRKGEYPIVMNDVAIYPNAVIAGDVEVLDHTTVGANVLLTRSTVSGETVRYPG